MEEQKQHECEYCLLTDIAVHECECGSLTTSYHGEIKEYLPIEQLKQLKEENAALTKENDFHRKNESDMVKALTELVEKQTKLLNELLYVPCEYCGGSGMKVGYENSLSDCKHCQGTGYKEGIIEQQKIEVSRLREREKELIEQNKSLFNACEAREKEVDELRKIVIDVTHMTIPDQQTEPYKWDLMRRAESILSKVTKDKE